MTIAFRLATDDDRHFAEETWCASFRSSYFAGPLAPWDRQRWREFALPEMRRILSGPNVKIHVAYNPEMPPETKSDIFGWLAIERRPPWTPAFAHADSRLRVVAVAPQPLVIYAFVKKQWRGKPWHFGRALCREAGLDPWRDRFDYICRTEWLMQYPKEGSRWTLPVVERMRLARWTPRAMRWRTREDEHEEPAADATAT